MQGLTGGRAKITTLGGVIPVTPRASSSRVQVAT
jgi:hypothetical protein